MTLEVSSEVPVLEIGKNDDGYFVVVRSPSGLRMQFGVAKEFWDTLRPDDMIILALRKAE